MSKTVTRILLLEDNPGDAMLLEATLAEAGPEYEVTHVERLTQGLARLASEPYDLVLADLSLPDSQGLTTVKQLRASAPSAPVLVLSGLDDEDMALQAVQSGAEGYLVKWRFGANMLTRTISQAIEHRQQVTALEERLQELEAWRDLSRQAAELVSDGLLLIDAGGTIAMANPAASRALGRQQAELVGTFVGLIDADNAAHTLQVLAAPGSATVTNIRLATTNTRDGHTVLVLFS